jgi:glycosyltransferase involved in cell wall biosynthesis
MSDGTALRVLHVCAPARAGGLESVVHQLTVGLHQKGHEVAVAAVLSPAEAESHPFVSALRAAGVAVHVIVAGARDYQDERREIRTLMRQQRTQVLHTHGYRSDVINGSLGHGELCAHVTTLHGFTARTWRGQLYEWLQVRVARRADAAVAVSQPIATRLRTRRNESRVHLIRNAVAPAIDPFSRQHARELLGLPQDAFLVGWIGRMSYEKGPDLFVEAMQHQLVVDRLEREMPMHGVMVGDGPMRQQVQRASEESGHSPHVYFTGMIEGASRYLAAFDALALTSRTEGTPMIILEAMLAGVPIVATAVGGIPDVLDVQSAYLATPTSAAIATAMMELVTHQDERAAKSRTAYQLVRQSHDYDDWIRAYEQAYRHARKERPPVEGEA